MSSKSSRDSSPTTSARLSYFEIEQKSSSKRSKVNYKVFSSIALAILFIASTLVGVLCINKTFHKHRVSVPKRRIFNSVILNDNENENLVKIGNFMQANLLYRGSRDGFHAFEFHSKCDNKSNTITLIKSNKNSIFGGYTSQAWSSSNKMINDTQAYLFSLRRDNITNVVGEKFDIRSNETWCALFDYASHGPTFGCNHDIFIYERPDLISKSYTNFCLSYSCKTLTNITHAESKAYLAGANYFYVTEIEVFNVN